MNKNKFLTAGLVAACLFGTISCKDQLDIKNPNVPTAAVNVANETGLYQLVTGATYINGFFNGDAWLGNSYFSLPMGYNELIADNVGASASNNQVTTVGQPDYVLYPDDTKKTNPSPAIGILRTYNNRASTGANNNAIHYQWLNMYALNSSMNYVLTLVDGIPFSGDADSKIHTVKAWAYWWKGYAYQSIAAKYYSGLIINEYGKTNSDYVGHDVVMAESTKYFDLAISEINAVTDVAAYTAAFEAMLPDQNETGRGGALSKDEWIHNINTMKARNILWSKISPFVNGNPNATITGHSFSGAMTASDWNAILTLTADETGLGKEDKLFTGRTTGANDFFTATGGSVASLTAQTASTATFKISERVLQNFKDLDDDGTPDDARFTNNFRKGGPSPLNPADLYNNDYIYSTRYTPVSGGNGEDGVWVYADRTIGAYELIMASSWEESALIRAEALIRTGDIDGGLALVDEVRDFMGAGIPEVADTGLDEAEAMAELAAEKRVAMLFRGLSFYDLRRWGWTYDVSKGGGAYDQNIVDGGDLITGVLFNYNFMDFWDVPAAESVLNPPSDGSSPVVNPNF